MTERKRIFLNICATYGRSLFSLAVGVFTARWALNALGKVDYGLVGVVGGLTSFVAFINGLLSFSVSRFYAVSVGAEKRAGGSYEEGLEECRKWFNTALFIHTVIPVVLLMIGYPVGEWAVRHFLTIPADRVEACVWVWRFTCVNCFVGMISVPFNAMYGAKQDIAELTIYGFATTTLNALFLYYMITHPAVWLVKYCLWMCAIGTSVTTIQMLRSFFKYNECRLNVAYLWSLPRFKEIVVFGFARLWTQLSNIVSGQGNVILVNKYLGPEFNASMSLGRTVVAHTGTLSHALTRAFSPAIMNAAGAGDAEKVRRLSFQQCRLGTLLVLIFILPLALEIREVLVLWLKSPPVFVAELVLAIMVDMVFERMSEGLYMPIMAFGKGVVRYSWWAGWCGFLRFGVAFVLLAAGFGLYGVCIALIVARLVVVAMRLYMCRKLAGMSVRYWIFKVFCPIVLLCIITLSIGLVTRFLPPSFLRVVLTTVVCELVFLPCAWFLVLTEEERVIMRERIGRMFAKSRRG